MICLIQVVTIPRRSQPRYRPQADYAELQAALAVRQQEAHLADHQQEVQLASRHQEARYVGRQQNEAAAASPTTPPPRSAIYVTTARTPVPRTYNPSGPGDYRAQSAEAQQRPLTQAELNALINAGFSVPASPGQEEEYAQQYYRGLTKRQNSRPKIGKVPLSNEERQLLAKNGIRNLYRVQSAESQDSPVTYVLAVENQKRDTDKSTSS